MLISLNKLKELLPEINLDPSITKVINSLGFEVESIEKFADIEGLKFGIIQDLYINPNDKRLTVATVKHKDGISTIQTTDTILKVDDLVVFFPVGSRKNDLIFTEKEIKGIKSEGMFAALSELNYKHDLVDKNGDHILVLPKNFATLNDDPIKKLGLDDYIIDISTTANRNDANSYFTLANEISAYYDKEFNFNFIDTKDSFDSKIIVNKNLAHELTFFEVKNTNDIQSDLETRLFLAKHDIDANLGFFVNLTNLTLLFTGATCHVYDRDKIGNNISCDLFTGKTQILGNKDVEVKDVLAIYDENGEISLASVMGLEKTKVTQNSVNLAFEIGVFNPSQVRHSAKEIKMQSNSSNQASRVITPEILVRAVSFLRKNLAQFELSNIINLPLNLTKKEIKMNYEKLALYAGVTVEEVKDKFNNTFSKLSKLGFKFVDDLVIVPNYRYDIEFFEDIIEEIFRFYSYSNFNPIQPNIKPLLTKTRDNLKNLIQSNGYQEVRTFSLISKAKNFINPFNFSSNVSLLTFVSKEREQIRNSISVSLQEVIEYNQKRKIDLLNIFEIGMINDNKFVCGFASTIKTFFELKQDIVNIFKLNDVEFIPFKDNEMIHPNVSAKILSNNELIGWIGKIHPKVDNTNAFYAEIMLDNVSQKIKFTDINYEPLKTIDLTFTLDKYENITNKINEIKNIAKIFDVVQIDEYHKENTKNVTLRIYANEQEIELINNKYNK
ncbi:phenylalanine--tRNA ligase subunit beta [Mycoplasmopsis anatis]|uniref:phenylalanine--tRNA ligase subunit beta n=1 Tax=Mycoplasmopsis anatis TaxID=171279 RepID=UPI001C4E1E7D|nr:phenylalanine--tRNA ligase subunit beta [Mycoplasmopsis anatis]MBW0594760.1 phenylalanine--tRNA ligase subunit beta [Mycoplasmopsis anatis]MBW0595434.1 phenylalanine--tRNA ligase subunit beta [Mycoplasmopsis anatis]MBW0598337.1 phenylalanine--tRNA ligase subunit beta [Mycoplasmopsis anatis]MBW0601299.1 phenylalanine--tRNA ligase subunit beta [Mycoplasmopsis anatis]MBW0602021.1 phenylalanine--tRNA ligase subunit beta [Mycoplasmopsis anatis]